uniref:Uncharacterized protein n=1 Tax=Pristionchus pacificus TaxID=54126 RepID=A0A2A6B7F1_PRIPA|eukprot:PDM61819.1 hypothetical protein PRIPAC_51261 [Pristionchus pacificus]
MESIFFASSSVEKPECDRLVLWRSSAFIDNFRDLLDGRGDEGGDSPSHISEFSWINPRTTAAKRRSFGAMYLAGQIEQANDRCLACFLKINQIFI